MPSSCRELAVICWMLRKRSTNMTARWRVVSNSSRYTYRGRSQTVQWIIIPWSQISPSIKGRRSQTVHWIIIPWSQIPPTIKEGSSQTVHWIIIPWYQISPSIKGRRSQSLSNLITWTQISLSNNNGSNSNINGLSVNWNLILWFPSLIPFNNKIMGIQVFQSQAFDLNLFPWSHITCKYDGIRIHVQLGLRSYRSITNTQLYQIPNNDPIQWHQRDQNSDGIT